MSRVRGQAMPGAVENLSPDFARRLIRWQRLQGRHGLPWQNTRDPYLVWLSEVMLQQTQVSSVLLYYPRFVSRFPTVQGLAAATADDVMALWSGLGYYSRARNLLRCAQVVVAEHGGVFPATASELQVLPGIGASTAAAIAAFCHGERVSILDGNVRRVLSRLLAFGGDLAKPGHQKELLALAQKLLPDAPTADDMTAYTQGLMDLGATVCTRARASCESCPVQALCRASAHNQVDRFPVKTRSVKRRHESWWLLLMHDMDHDRVPRIWLERRPPKGIWAGLHCLPVFDSEASLLEALPTGVSDALEAMEPIAHSLTHRELRLHPLRLALDRSAPESFEAAQKREGSWVALDTLAQYGLPAPVRQLLANLARQS